MSGEIEKFPLITKSKVSPYMKWKKGKKNKNKDI